MSNTKGKGDGRGLVGKRLRVGLAPAGLATLGTMIILCYGCASTPQGQPQLEHHLQQLVGDVSGPIHYFAQQADLNGDGRPETIVHVAGPMVCGTGGCNTAVFTPERQGLRTVAWISVTRPPIAVAETNSNGWRDLIVRVSGGGIIPGYDARLRYDGLAYPENPTVPPAEPVADTAPATVLIPEFRSFTEGRLLRAGGS